MMKEQIESALLAATSSRPGATVPAQPRGVAQVMVEAGLLSPFGNLTVKGAEHRKAIARRREDEAFG